MKKIISIALAIVGLEMAASAQTLLYQWAFTNITDTTSNSAPSYAITPGTGNLIVQNVSASVYGQIGIDGINPMVYFTNNAAGPGSGPGVYALGSYVANGSGYNSGNTAVAIATNLNLGTLYQFTVTCWVRLSSFDVGSLSRMVEFGAANNYDAGGKGPTVNGIGSALNNQPTGYPCFQNGVGGPAGTGNQNDTMSVTNCLVNGLPEDGATWIFEAMTYDGTQTSGNFINWVGLTNQAIQHLTLGVNTANYGGIQFTTNATVMIGNDNVSGSPRALPYGAIADVRIYSGIVVSNDLELIRQFQIPALLNNPVLTPATNITTQPASGTTFVGGSRTFSVTAFANPAVFTYLWRSNNVPIPGGTSSSVTLSNLQLSASGASIVCSVSNVIGGTNTIPAILTMVPVSTAGDYAKAVLSYNPYSFWLINEASNSVLVSVYDYVGGHDGQAKDPTNMMFMGGPSSPNFYGFPANNTSIETLGAAGASRLNMAGPGNFVNSGMTIVGWVYTPSAGSAGNGIIYNEASDVGPFFGLTFGATGTGRGGNGSEVDYVWGPTPATAFTSGIDMNSNEWTFVALVISTNATPDTNATLYVGSESLGLLNTNDSSALSLRTIGTGSDANILALGRSTPTSSENGGFYTGTTSQYSDVAVFYSALSSSQITNLFLNGVGLHLQGVRDPSVAGNLLMNWTYGHLQSSINVAGPYSDVAGTSNTVPYSVPMTGQLFYRLRLAP
jgi:hypothetical protein